MKTAALCLVFTASLICGALQGQTELELSLDVVTASSLSIPSSEVLVRDVRSSKDGLGSISKDESDRLLVKTPPNTKSFLESFISKRYGLEASSRPSTLRLIKLGLARDMKAPGQPMDIIIDLMFIPERGEVRRIGIEKRSYLPPNEENIMRLFTELMDETVASLLHFDSLSSEPTGAVKEDVVEEQPEDEGYAMTDVRGISNMRKEKQSWESAPSNLSNFGFLMGGIAIAGFEQELRVSRHLGVNLGLGFIGYTAGLKVHTSPATSSSFFLLSLKDGGIGGTRGFGLEYGDRIIFNRKDDARVGLYLRGGVTLITFIDDNLVSTLATENVSEGSALFSFGIGMSLR